MTYEQAITYYESTFGQGTKASADEFGAALRRLGDPHKAVNIIHIAGTNGKGSVCALLESVLRSAGYTTGMFTSPHLTSVTERFRYNGGQIAAADFAESLSRVKEAADGISFSYFQLLTLICFVYFRDKAPDFLLLETGIGGLNDCTNVVLPILSVITRVGLDHTAILGGTIELIAAQKAGIIKEGRPVAISAQRQEAFAVIAETAARKHAKLYTAGEPLNIKSDLYGFTADFEDMPNLRVNLGGAYQPLNAAAALAAITALREKGVVISGEAVRAGFAKAAWRGRFEVVSKRPLVIMDGAHNEDGALALQNSINQLLTNREITLILAVLDTKDRGAILRALVPLADTIIFTKPSYGLHAVPPEALAKEAAAYAKRGALIKTRGDCRGALAAACGSINDNTAIIAAGSLYLIGDFYMINFEEELKNYQPLPDLDDLERDVNPDALIDVLKLLTNQPPKPRPTGGK